MDISPNHQKTVEQQYDTLTRTPNIAQCQGIPDNKTAILLKQYGVKLSILNEIFLTLQFRFGHEYISKYLYDELAE